MSKSPEFKTILDNPDNPKVKDVTPEEVKALKENLQLIDVRQPNEFTGELGHIEGANLIVLDTLPQKVSEIDRDKTTVFVCRSGGRSARAAAFAQEQGLTQCYNMAGGMLKWNELGFEVEGRNQD